MNKEDLRIVFLGTPEFAVESLSRLVDGGYNVVGVVTMPDKPAGRGHKMYESPVKLYAKAHGLHLMQPAKLKDESFIAELKSLRSNLFIVIAFRMLPEVVWTMPELGTFNLHASLLPKYRGAAPINWAVINGDTETGVTTFFLKHEIDTGDILRQERIEICPEDNVGSVHDKLMLLGADLTIDTVEHIIKGDLTPVAQDSLLKGAEPTPAPKIFRETCRIDWTKPAVEIHNLVRGLSPYPAAWTEIDGDTLKIYATRLTVVAASSIGKIVIEGKKMFVGTCDNLLEILELQPSGKKRMKAVDFINGHKK
ncbi:MAG: methionyl-tRNA formyltransferase [Muribaculaceae bacterium]|nr:methionyl-tRNA formyltransferase [Muribaculaceae bacterium]